MCSAFSLIRNELLPNINVGVSFGGSSTRNVYISNLKVGVLTFLSINSRKILK